MPTCFLFKKMDQAYLREIIKNKEDLFKTDLKSLYQTDEVNENIVEDFYIKYHIYVTPFRFIYCQLKESQDFNFDMYFMSYTTSALIIDQDNLYEDCDNQTRIKHCVDDVFATVSSNNAAITTKTKELKNSK